MVSVTDTLCRIEPLPTYADNVALPAAAPAAAAIDRYFVLAGPTAANPPHAAIEGEWDRQTDTVPFPRA